MSRLVFFKNKNNYYCPSLLAGKVAGGWLSEGAWPANNESSEVCGYLLPVTYLI